MAVGHLISVEKTNKSVCGGHMSRRPGVTPICRNFMRIFKLHRQKHPSLLPLTGSPLNEIQRQKYPDVTLEYVMFHVKGHIPGVPVMSSCRVIVYNVTYNTGMTTQNKNKMFSRHRL